MTPAKASRPAKQTNTGTTTRTARTAKTARTATTATTATTAKAKSLGSSTSSASSAAPAKRSTPKSPSPTRKAARPHPLIAAVRPVVDAVGGTLVPASAAEASDVPLVWEGVTVGAVRMPPLHGALDRLIEAVETELGDRLAQLPRESKQKAIRLLDERGAFTLRRAVEDVADAMSVSRITVYNYLNAIHR